MVADKREGLGEDFRKKRKLKDVSMSFNYILHIFLHGACVTFLSVIQVKSSSRCNLINRFAPDSILYFHLKTMIHNIHE